MGEIDKPYHSTPPSQAKEWEDPSLRWEEMEAGIFEKIVAEDPQFFDRRRKRRLLFWWSFCALTVLVGGLLGWYLQQDFSVPATQEIDRPIPGMQDEAPPIVMKEAPVQSQTAERIIPQVVSTGPIAERASITQQSQPNSGHQTPSTTEERAEANATSHSAMRKMAVAQVLNNSIPLIEDKEPPHIELNIQMLPPTATPQKKERSKALLAAYGGGIYSNSEYEGPSFAGALRNTFTSPLFGYEFGVEWRQPLMSHSEIGLGVGYQSVFQNIDSYTERQVPVEVTNAVVEITHFRVGDRTSYEHGDVTTAGTEKNRLVQYNSQRNLLLSAKWNQQVQWRSWRVRASAGVIGLKTMQTEGRTLAADGAIIAYDQENPILHSWQLQSQLGLMISRPLNAKVALEVGYQWRRQWSNTSLEDGLIWRPDVHFLGAGMTIRL